MDLSEALSDHLMTHHEILVKFTDDEGRAEDAVDTGGPCPAAIAVTTSDSDSAGNVAAMML